MTAGKTAPSRRLILASFFSRRVGQLLLLGTNAHIFTIILLTHSHLTW